MNDAEHILMIVFIGVIIVLVNIWRVSIKRRRPDDEKDKAELPSTLDMEKEFDDDPVINPGYSSLKSNIFHKDRYDNDN